jgi:hypothetical protein
MVNPFSPGAAAGQHDDLLRGKRVNADVSATGLTRARCITPGNTTWSPMRWFRRRCSGHQAQELISPRTSRPSRAHVPGEPASR